MACAMAMSMAVAWAMAWAIAMSMAGGTDSLSEANVFTLTTLSDGLDQNSVGTETTNNLLVSGSRSNLRWEVSRVKDIINEINIPNLKI